MPAEVYEVVSQAARYWFLFLMAMIVWRSYRWFAKDRKQRKKRLRLLPDAGYVGEWVVLRGSEELAPGIALPVPREGILGFVRSCDLCIPVRGVAKKHLWFSYSENEGMRIEGFGRHPYTVDGVEYAGRRQHGILAHGSRLQVGEAELRLRLFAGFETTARPHVVHAAGFENDENSADAAVPVPPQSNMPPAAMTPEQFAVWQQQYQLLAQQQLATQQMVMQALAGQRAAQGASMNAPAHAESDEDEYDQPVEEEDDSYEEDLPEGFVLVREEESAPVQSPPQEILFDHQEVFYPPIEDSPTEEEDESWPYAPIPQSDVVFENQGYTYPEFVGRSKEDEDMTDAAVPPKSLYVEPDEAERAKKLVWDRYFRGGQKR